MRAIRRIDTGAVLTLPRTEIEIAVLDAGVVRVRETGQPQNATLADFSAFSGARFDWLERPDSLTLTTGALRVDVTLAPFGVAFCRPDGTAISADLPGEALRTGPDGLRSMRTGAAGERIYGLGEKTGFLDKKGGRYEMWNTDEFAPHVPSTDPLYVSVPFYIALCGGGAYGIYHNNAYRSRFDFTEPGRHTVELEGGVLDYVFFAGPGIDGVVREYTRLTGRMAMPPLWALGYHQSRYSYCPDEELLEIAAELRERDIPCDVLHMDIHYLDRYRVFTFDDAAFPDPKGLTDRLRAQGFRTVAIENPGIARDARYGVYREGALGGYFVKSLDGVLYTGEVWPGDSAFPDVYRADVREWWASMQRVYCDAGIGGIWNDMNEPAIFNKSKTMDEDMAHGGGGDVRTHHEVHNLYGSLLNMATRDGLLRFRPDERPFVLTRAAFAGGQRYAAVWTGDNRSFYEHLAMALPMCMNLGLAGMAFCGCDTGGFTDDCTAELLCRWMQAGSLMPFFRNHSGMDTARQEPWAFGQEVERICAKYIRLRYALLPYLYDLFALASGVGAPVMRPLVYEFQRDENVYGISDQFMLGPWLMAAPVAAPGKVCREVYLPEGAWLDWHTGEHIEGGQYILADAALDIMPIYARAGAIIPMTPPMAHTGEFKRELLEVHIFPGGAPAAYTHVLDDGQSMSGGCSRVELTLEPQGAGCALRSRVTQADYPLYEGVTVVVRGFAVRACVHTDKDGKQTRLTGAKRADGVAFTFPARGMEFELEME